VVEKRRASVLGARKAENEEGENAADENGGKNEEEVAPAKPFDEPGFSPARQGFFAKNALCQKRFAEERDREKDGHEES
jgi:hypothetical protein